MCLLGNILWFIFGGFLSGLAWIAAGCLWCITIIGIPIGLQCFKFAGLAFWPFGKTVTYGCRTDFADIQNKKECGGNRQWQRQFLRKWAANTKGKAII